MTDKDYYLPVDLDKFLKKFDDVMQSGLEFRFFNRPVKDDYLWDIKVFWEHVDVKVSEGFDSMAECLEDCYKYMKDYDKN